jgi:hypothetical protein
MTENGNAEGVPWEPLRGSGETLGSRCVAPGDGNLAGLGSLGATAWLQGNAWESLRGFGVFVKRCAGGWTAK